MTELDKEKRISKEIKKLNKIFKNIPKDKLSVVNGLIKNSAFMAVSLEDLQNEINKNGYVETYQNGANQCGKKKSSEVELYNNIIKNYSSIVKQLIDLLPDDDKNNTTDNPLLAFIAGANGGGTK